MTASGYLTLLLLICTAGPLPLRAQNPPVAIRLLATTSDEQPLGPGVWVAVQARNITDTTIAVALLLEWPSPLVFLSLSDSANRSIVNARGMDYPDWYPGKDLIQQHLVHLKPNEIWKGYLPVGGDSTIRRGYVFDRPGIYFLSGLFQVFGDGGRTAWGISTDTLRLSVGG